MSAQRILGFAKVARFVAKWGSVAAATIFVWGFAADTQLMSSLSHFAAGPLTNVAVVVFLCKLISVFVCYWLAAKHNFETAASLMAISIVGALYGWCKVELNFYPGPFLAVLAVPPGFHLMAVLCERLATADVREAAIEEVAENESLPTSAAVAAA